MLSLVEITPFRLESKSCKVFITWLILTNSNWKLPIDLFWNQKKMITEELGFGWFKVTRNMKPQKVKVRITFRQRVNWHIYRLHYLGVRWYFCPFWPSSIIKEPCREKIKKETYTVNIYRYKAIEANGNFDVIPTTSKSFSLYWEFLCRYR